MKKYVKPELFYESFELSEQIALGCSEELMANSQDTISCEVINPLGQPTTFFADTNSNCKTHEFEGYCYTANADGFTIFAS